MFCFVMEGFHTDQSDAFEDVHSRGEEHGPFCRTRNQRQLLQWFMRSNDVLHDDEQPCGYIHVVSGSFHVRRVTSDADDIRHQRERGQNFEVANHGKADDHHQHDQLVHLNGHVVLKIMIGDLEREEEQVVDVEGVCRGMLVAVNQVRRYNRREDATHA